MANPLSRREVLKYGAFTTVGGVLTPGVVLASATVPDWLDIKLTPMEIVAIGYGGLVMILWLMVMKPF